LSQQTHCAERKGFLFRKQRRSGGLPVRPVPGTRCSRDEGEPEDRFPAAVQWRQARTLVERPAVPHLPNGGAVRPLQTRNVGRTAAGRRPGIVDPRIWVPDRNSCIGQDFW